MSHREHDDPSTRDADASIDRAWREASTEEPTARVDARILAAARKAVARHDADSNRGRTAEPHSHARWTWRPLLAAAAVAGLAFAILPPLLRQAERPVQPHPEGPVQPQAERSTNVPVASQPMQPERDTAVPAPSQFESSAAQSPSSATPAPSAAPAGSGPAAPATMPAERESRGPDSTEAAAAAKSAESAGSVVSQDAAAHDRAGSVAGPTAGQVPAPPVPTAEPPSAAEAAASTGESGALARKDRALTSAPAALSKSPALSTPTDRAAKIAALYESGDVTAAAAELRAFRATRPDADTYLPRSLQDWARTVK